MPYETILVESHDRVRLVRLNRPGQRNALNNQLIHELMDALGTFDRDDAVGAVVLTGTDTAFAAGADIKEMASQDAEAMRASGFIQAFGRFASLQKPVIAAVSGWALGGGCELALACDMIVASETARFGQPEISIGVIPGAGGTQRLVRAVGKSLAMEIILNNRTLSAQEALHFGLVNRVVPADRLLDEALGLAREIAGRAPLAVRAARQLIAESFEIPLAEGLERERRTFFDLFDTGDRLEGMQAFVEKRQPHWTGR
jgi:enoyl-CoA hydratase/carnithine racemase